MRATARRIVVRVLLCLVIAFQLGSASACRIEAGQRVNPELAALASALGHPIVLCHDDYSADAPWTDASSRSGHPSHSHRHGCCDCGFCGTIAHLPPPLASECAGNRVARPVAAEHPGTSFVLAFAPEIAATSPRGPPATFDRRPASPPRLHRTASRLSGDLFPNTIGRPLIKGDLQ